MSPSQIIVLATPVFLLLIALEFAWGLRKRRNTYRLNDAVNSISLGMMSEISKVFTRLLRVGIYGAVATHVSLVPASVAHEFWTAWYGWPLALLFYDFCYYWLHRAGHECALFWAAHAVHHQSQDYNLSTALRQTSSGALFGWVFYLPMALAGVPPIVFGTVALIDLLYQFWVHTEHVGKLGWVDRWFCSPSNHRVHHAVNNDYLDRNYGGVLIVWDRLFGSFQEEGEKCIYGTRSPLNSWDPLWSNAEVYWSLGRDSWHARNWIDKLRVWFKPPGWRPADVAARFPKPEFNLAQVQRYHPPVSQRTLAFASSQFLLLLGAVAFFLWHADSLPLTRSAVWLAALAAALWSVGAVLQGRVTLLEALLIEAAALSTATGAEGITALHYIFKPLAMLLALLYLARSRRAAGSSRRLDYLLGAGLACALIGDCLLMLPGLFIPGLVAFLVAHLCYLGAFSQGLPLLPGTTALLATLGVSGALYGVLYPGLNPVLRIAVGAYAVVIALMAAQAIGRAQWLQQRHARAVAVGAMLFMLSDALLAINRFALPLPMAQFWVLASYYGAQILIVTGLVRATFDAAARAPGAQPLPAS
jgi:alkylglycerol monooxygenase